MKSISKNIVVLIVLLITLFLFSFQLLMQTTEPWKKEQLMEPADLAAKIKKDASDKPIIVNIGPSGIIKGAVDIGPSQEEENLEALKSFIQEKAGDREVVVYCGCCPFKDCPNIRPAFKLFNELNFDKAHLLNIEQNLKVNWIEKGFPMEDND